MMIEHEIQIRKAKNGWSITFNDVMYEYHVDRSKKELLSIITTFLIEKVHE